VFNVVKIALNYFLYDLYIKNIIYCKIHFK